MTYYKSLFAILLAALLVVPNASAQPEEVPPDVFEAQPDGYLYADYPGVFDDAEGDEAFGDGITIEMWIYFTEIPPVRPQSHRWEHWLIVAKPGSYYINAAGLALLDGFDRILPEGTTSFIFAVEDPTRRTPWVLRSRRRPVPVRTRRVSPIALASYRLSDRCKKRRHTQYRILRPPRRGKTAVLRADGAHRRAAIRWRRANHNVRERRQMG